MSKSIDKRDEALKLALEALEYYQHRRIEWDYSDEVAITAIREALMSVPDGAARPRGEATLAQQQSAERGEPVAGVRCKIIENCKSCQHSVGRLSCSLAGRDFDSLERASTPPEWCPLPLYTPPQPSQRSVKPWVGLTDEQIEKIAARTLFPVNFARAIEAKLKEKNT